MARVILPTVDGVTVVPGDVCVQTGATTTDRITLEGSAAPRWAVLVPILWPYLFALLVRRYRIEMPMTHQSLTRWGRLHRRAWIGVLAGVVLAAVAAVLSAPAPGSLLAISAASLALGTWNGLAHRVGVRRTLRGRLVLTRVHPVAAEMIRRLGGS